VREIVADELERIDDPRLELVAVTTVSVEPDLRHATVLFDSLRGEEGDEEVVSAFGEHRVRLQRAIASQARLKRTPELAFRVDEVVRRADRVEEILRRLPERDADG
jgi:ribosome-binding factor A